MASSVGESVRRSWVGAERQARSVSSSSRSTACFESGRFVFFFFLVALEKSVSLFLVALEK